MSTIAGSSTSTEDKPVKHVWWLITGGMVTRAIYTVCKLHVPDALADGPRTVDELAGDCGGDTDALGRYLRVLTGAGLFREDATGAFHLTDAGHLLRSDVPGTMWPFAVLADELIEPTSTAALFSARTGRSAFDHLHGCSLYDHLAADPDAEALFAWAMTSRAARLHREVIEAIDWNGVRHVVDVGGNHGAFLTAILTHLPMATGVLFDQPQVAAGARDALEAAGVADRVDVAPGDFFTEVPPGGDLYLVANVLWNWDDGKAATILRHCRDAMADSARLVVVEPVVPDGDEPHLARIHDLVNFWLNGGRTRGASEWRTLLGAAGFELRSITETPLQWSVIEAGPRVSR